MTINNNSSSGVHPQHHYTTPSNQQSSSMMSTPPVNYDIFSLNKLFCLSTGAYQEASSQPTSPTSPSSLLEPSAAASSSNNVDNYHRIISPAPSSSSSSHWRNHNNNNNNNHLNLRGVKQQQQQQQQQWEEITDARFSLSTNDSVMDQPSYHLSPMSQQQQQSSQASPSHYHNHHQNSSLKNKAAELSWDDEEVGMTTANNNNNNNKNAKVVDDLFFSSVMPSTTTATNNNNNASSSQNNETSTAKKSSSNEQQQQQQSIMMSTNQVVHQRHHRHLATLSPNKVSAVNDSVKPVSFRQVISDGHKGLYHVIACLCSNDVILLRFVGVVTTSKNVATPAASSSANNNSSGSVQETDEASERSGHSVSTSDDDPTEMLGVADLLDDEPVAALGDRRFRTVTGKHGNVDDEEDATSVQLCSPIVRCITYFKDFNVNISCITLGHHGKWLTCVTHDGDVFIVPVCRLLFPYVSDNSWPFREPTTSASAGSSGVGSMVNSSQRGFVSLKDYTTFVTESNRSEKSTTNILNHVKELELVMTSKPIHAKMTANSSIAKNRRLYNIKKHGKCMCSTWWLSFEQASYLLFGTDKGFVIILNIQSQTEEGVIQISNSPIKRMNLIVDPQRKFKYLLISCSRGNFFKLVLEQEDYDFHTYKNICEYYGNENAIHTMTNEMKRDMEDFKPTKLERLCQSYPCRVRVYDDSKKGPMLTCFSNSTHQFSIFDPESQRFPLYVYQLNNDSALVHCTDKLLFSVQKPKVEVSKSNEQPEKLWVSSRMLLMSGNASGIDEWSYSHKGVRSSRNAAVFQEFVLPNDQVILGFLPGFGYRSKGNHVLDDSEVADEDEPNEEEGVFVYTQNAIYELKEKNSPKDIFKHILVNSNGIGRNHAFSADQFGKTFGLDLFNLYERAADEAYQTGNYKLAFNLYSLSNVSESKLVSRLMQSHRINSVLDYLSATLSSPDTLSMKKRSELSDMLLLSFMFRITTSYVPSEQTSRTKQTEQDQENNSESASEEEESSQILLVTKTDENRDDDPFHTWNLGHQKNLSNDPNIDVALWRRFRHFLHSNQDYNPSLALTHLIARGFIGLSLEVAHKNKLMAKCLQLLVRKGYIILQEQYLDFLYEFDYSSIVFTTGDGILLKSCSPSLYAKFIMSYLQYLKRQKEDHSKRRRDLNERSDDFGSPYFGYTEKKNTYRCTFFEDDIHRKIHLQLPSTLFSLIPYIRDEQILVQIAEFFNPEQTTFSHQSSQPKRVSEKVDKKNLFFSDTLALLEQKQPVKKVEKPEKSVDVDVPGSFDKDYHFPYIHKQQHIELYLLTLLCLCFLKKQRASMLMSTTHTTNPVETQDQNQKKQSFARNSFLTSAQEKLEEALRTFTEHYRKQFILRKCLQYQNKSGVTVIYETSSMWMEALCCKLSQIKDTYSTFITHYTDNNQRVEFTERIARNILSIFEKYVIRSMPEEQTNRTSNEEMKDNVQSQMILKIFLFWHDMDLPLTLIEEYCLKHLHVIGDSLSYILMQYEGDETNRPFHLPFSHKFYLKITQTFVKSIKKHHSEENVSNHNLQLQILRNMEKDIQARVNVTSLVSSLMSKMIIFSCSHKYPYKTFYGNLLTEFKSRMQPFILEEKTNEPTQPSHSVATHNTVDIEKYLTEKLRNGDSDDVHRFICTVAMKLVLADYQLASELTDVKETSKQVLLNQSCPICVFNTFCKYSRTGTNQFWST